jgi:predicted O-methyltransferase YrrM
MIELIGQPGYETISQPDSSMLRDLSQILDSGNVAPCIAEIGVGIGATTVAVCRLLDNRGHFHLFDYAEKLTKLQAELAALGFTNLECLGNSRRHWDSYNWSLLALIERESGPIYDYVYVDGAHTVLHDALAFYLIDQLLKPGGCINFDDYYWSFATSPGLNPQRNPKILEFLTEEQIKAKQVKLVVDVLVARHPRYECVEKNKVYRKVS